MLDSVRVRLTLWYSLVLAVTLLVFAGVVYWIVARNAMARTDSDLTQLADAFLVTFDDEISGAENSAGFLGAANQSMLEHRYRDQIIAIVDSSYAVVAKSSDLPLSNERSQTDAEEIVSSPELRTFAKESWTKERAFATLPGRHTLYRGYARRFVADHQSYELIFLHSLHSQHGMLERLRLAFAWMIPFGLALAALGGYFLTQKTLAPVAEMGATASHITAANLHERLPVKNPADELGRLASSFNALLDRLDRAFDEQKRFIADASHELRTPVAILSGEAEVALSQKERSAADYKESLTVLHQEARRLARIVEDLFTLTRADSGQYSLSPQDFYLDELVASCVHSARTLALAKNISLSCKMPGELPIHADHSLLRRLFLNLIDNAIKHSDTNSQILVEARSVSGGYEVVVSDTGTGIPQELQSRIFERFFRVDPARSRFDQNGGGGAGLGLSIARWIAEAHHGRLELVRSNSQGSTFSVYLPASFSDSSAPH